VLQGAGLSDHAAPELSAVNYAPRVRIPTLMLNGRYDFDLPLETSQRPLFALFGSPTDQKQHVVLETGHALPVDDVAREMLPWLDGYLGRVARSERTRTQD
jgi:eukaryotic-like serine/threonine-protein kinase